MKLTQKQLREVIQETLLEAPQAKASSSNLVQRMKLHALNALSQKVKRFVDDDQMINMFVSDFQDTLAIAKLVQAGNMKQAVQSAFQMDTAARDELLSDFWREAKKSGYSKADLGDL